MKFSLHDYLHLIRVFAVQDGPLSFLTLLISQNTISYDSVKLQNELENCVLAGSYPQISTNSSRKISKYHEMVHTVTSFTRFDQNWDISVFITRRFLFKALSFKIGMQFVSAIYCSALGY